MKRRVESLSRRQRECTPLPFCHYLIHRVRTMYRTDRVAVLWLNKRSKYYEPGLPVECWGPKRNARLYSGPWPIIAHPPCGPWARHRSRCHQSKEDGIAAMRLVHKYGGVVEQPLGSQLFRHHGCFGWVELVKQGSYGHLADKPTLLYFVAPWQVI